jgi:hypothetical protein
MLYCELGVFHLVERVEGWLEVGCQVLVRQICLKGGLWASGMWYQWLRRVDGRDSAIDGVKVSVRFGEERFDEMKSLEGGPVVVSAWFCFCV